MSKLEIAKRSVELAQSTFESNVNQMDLDLNFQKESAFAMQIFQANDYLAGMDPNSIRDAIVNVSLTGISLNPVLKMAYLVPRKGKCVLDVSYIGLIKIVTDTGSVKNIEAKIVYSNEPFEIQQGTNPYIKHGISPTKDKGQMVGCYSVATLNDGSTSVEWMYKEDIDAIMMRSEAVKADKMSPWKSDYDQMARKTVVKRHYKFLPKSERGILASNAINVDDQNNGIDFAKESKKPSTVSIDVLDNQDESIVSEFQSFLDKMRDGTVPNKLTGKTGQEIDVVASLDGLEKQFNEGSLHKAKFEQWQKYLDSVYEKSKNG